MGMTATRTRTRTKRNAGAATRSEPEKGLGLLGRVGLAGRTVFYAILTALAIRIALLGRAGRHEADANGALGLVSRPLLGQAAIAAVALGFFMFGIDRLIGAWRDHTVSTARRWMTAIEGVFYLVLSYVPAAFLAGNHRVGSQKQQQKTTSELLNVPGGRWLVGLLGIIVLAVCTVQIYGATRHQFRDGLDLRKAPRVIRRFVDQAGAIGITARALVFLPIGVFLIIAAIQASPGHSEGTDGELLILSHYSWGVAVLAAVAAGLAVFVVFSAIETRYRRVVSAR
jgi:hypothetical protein